MQELLSMTLPQARKTKSIRQQDVADHLGMVQSTYAYKEKHGGFDNIEKQKIAKYLKIDMTHIVWSSTYQTKTGVSENEKDRLIKMQDEQIKFLEQQVIKLTAVIERLSEKR